MSNNDRIYDQVMELIERYASSTPDLKEVAASLDSHMAFFAKCKQMNAYNLKLSEEAMEEMGEATDPEKTEEIIKNFDASMKSVDKFDARRDDKYVEFVAKLDETMDEDIVDIQASRQVIDPISKKRMVDPVKNKLCGHSYEKQTVIELIRVNAKTRCPMIGCSEYLSKKDLIADDDLRRYLASTPEDDNANASADISKIVLDDTV